MKSQARSPEPLRDKAFRDRTVRSGTSAREFRDRTVVRLERRASRTASMAFHEGNSVRRGWAVIMGMPAQGRPDLNNPS
jgi:hypothetical protein